MPKILTNKEALTAALKSGARYADDTPITRHVPAAPPPRQPERATPMDKVIARLDTLAQPAPAPAVAAPSLPNELVPLLETIAANTGKPDPEERLRAYDFIVTQRGEDGRVVNFTVAERYVQ